MKNIRANKTAHFYKGNEQDKIMLQNFLDAIDWAPFHQYLQQKFGFDTGLKTSIVVDDGRYKIRLVGTDNLVYRCGILAPCFRDVHIEDFGSAVGRNVDYDEGLFKKALKEGTWRGTWDDFDAKYGPIVFSVHIDFRYVMKDGGRNGLSLFDAIYSEQDGWTFSV